MNLEEAVAIFANDGIFHLASANRSDNVRKMIAEPFNPEVHYPIIYLHTHYAMLKEAKTLLDSVPNKEDETYKQLEDYYNALKECERVNHGIFPLNVPYRDWWNGPHLSFPEGYIDWNPFQIDVIIEEGDTEFSCVMGKKEEDGIHYGFVTLPIDKCRIRPEVDMFGEIAFYSDDDDDFIIDFHREKIWVRPPELNAVYEKIQPYMIKSNELLNERIMKDIESWKDDY